MYAYHNRLWGIHSDMIYLEGMYICKYMGNCSYSSVMRVLILFDEGTYKKHKYDVPGVKSLKCSVKVPLVMLRCSL